MGRNEVFRPERSFTPVRIHRLQVDNTFTEWLGSGQFLLSCSRGIACMSSVLIGLWSANWLLQMALRLIHNRPGPVRCENAWNRSVTSQQRAGPEKGDCG